MKTDARKLSPEIQKEKRRIALKMRENGYGYEEISELLEVHKNTIGNWVAKKNKKGKENTIAGGERGAKPGQLRTLNAEQEKVIRRLIFIHTPDKFKFPDGLWTRKAVKKLIAHRYTIDMPIRTVGEYLKRWGFSPQKPLKKTYEQNRHEVEKWLKEDYPAIKDKALKEGGEIHWADETGVTNQCQYGRSYALVGRTPVLHIAGKRFKINMISTLTNQGKVRFMLYREKMKAEVLISFLEKLIEDTGRKVFLILDNLRVHRSKLVSEWVSARQDRIELYFLPAYSPELNPDEYLNCDLKYQVHSKTSPKSQKELEQKVHSSMQVIQLNADRVKKYFQDPFIQYAA